MEWMVGGRGRELHSVVPGAMRGVLDGMGPRNGHVAALVRGGFPGEGWERWREEVAGNADRRQVEVADV